MENDQRLKVVASPIEGTPVPYDANVAYTPLPPIDIQNVPVGTVIIGSFELELYANIREIQKLQTK